MSEFEEDMQKKIDEHLAEQQDVEALDQGQFIGLHLNYDNNVKVA